MLTDKSKWGAYWFTHRDSFHSSHWEKVKKTPHGKAHWDFLIKCAYFACYQEKWTMEDFAHEIGASITTARRYADHFASVYGICLIHGTHEHRPIIHLTKQQTFSLFKGVKR